MADLTAHRDSCKARSLTAIRIFLLILLLISDFPLPAFDLRFLSFLLFVGHHLSRRCGRNLRLKAKMKMRKTRRKEIESKMRSKNGSDSSSSGFQSLVFVVPSLCRASSRYRNEPPMRKKVEIRSKDEKAKDKKKRQKAR
ncbi:MAG: hypothetical protein QF473_38735 [Planctomycetota bacterium]|nr:hypothetical protein [Planctomycetota bacterium]